MGTKALLTIGFTIPQSPNGVAAAAAHKHIIKKTVGYAATNPRVDLPQYRDGIKTATGWKVPILTSYAYWDNRCIPDFAEWEGRYRLLIDSGAFTAHTIGKQINFDEYCDFVKTPPVPLEGYFVLDVIGDPVATMKNYRKMLQRGLKPIPIFTRGADPVMADEYWESSKLIGLGGVAMGGEGYVKWFEERVRKGRNVHWLGFGRRDMVLHYKPTSYDSSVWIGGCRFGYISLFHTAEKELKVQREDILAGKYVKDIEAMGFDCTLLKSEDAWHRHENESYIGKISAVSWLLWARKLGGVGVTAAAAKDHGTGTPNSPANTHAAQKHLHTHTRAYSAVDGSGRPTSNATAKRVLEAYAACRLNRGRSHFVNVTEGL